MMSTISMLTFDNRLSLVTSFRCTQLLAASSVCAHGASQSQLHQVSCCCPMQPHLLQSNFEAIDMLQVKSPICRVDAPFHNNCRTSDVRA
jgi:hypothetical protein